MVKNISNLTEIMGDFVRALAPDREDLSFNAFDVLIKSEPWRFYLASFGVEAYNRSIKNSGFSKDVNAGSIDTQQMIYLAIVDAFITEDPYQERTLRIIERFGDRKRNIWSTNKLISAIN